MMTNYLVQNIKELKKKYPSVLISVVGGGGKTTTIFQLANQLKADASVLITTTTAMFHPHEMVDHLHYKTLPNIDHKKNEIVALYKDYISEKDKMCGVDKQMVHQVLDEAKFDYIFTEADGARRKALKAYAEHEPVIPDRSHVVIVVIGADVIGKLFTADTVHRIDEFSEITGLQIGDLITDEALINVITHPNGFLKELPEKALVYLVINKSLSFPLPFNKSLFVETIFDRTNCYKAVLFSEMINFEFDQVFENKNNFN